jgi:glycosyltransferase involved in cell wall biosynthesis
VTAAASIVVPTRNRAGYLRVCLNSLAAQQVDAPFEVIVADDGSSDTTAAVAEEAGAKVVQTAAQGPNAARNAGLRAAEGDLLVFVDDDVEAPRDWLAAYLDGAERHPDAEAFGGPIRARFEGRTPRSCGREPAPITTLDLGSEDREADFVWGANMAVRRRAFDRLGPFDEQLPQFGE